jgi:hypothetical protein
MDPETWVCALGGCKSATAHVLQRTELANADTVNAANSLLSDAERRPPSSIVKQSGKLYTRGCCCCCCSVLGLLVSLRK